MLPFEPETTEELKKRFSKALERIWIVPDNLSMPDRPGLHRDYVFDFKCRTRLLISQDAFEGQPSCIHVSASWEDDSPFIREFQHHRYYTVKRMTEVVQDHYTSIGGIGTIKLVGVSTAMIPHWIVK